MTTKRIITIIVSLLVLLFLILGGIWLIGRHTAQKNGTTPLSFRQFLGLGTSAKPASTAGGTLTSQFTNTSSTGNGGTSGATTGSGTAGTDNGTGMADNTQTSQFTDNGINPVTGSANGITVGSSTGLGGSSGLGAGSIGSSSLGNGALSGNGISVGNSSTVGASTGTAAPVCSDEDMNITFTPAELAQLKTLETRFYSIAQTLHTDADVATEVSNHDSFALKADQAKELYAYCQSKVSIINSIGDARLQKRVATPFWHAWSPSLADLQISFTAPEIAEISQAPADQDTFSFIDVPSYCASGGGGSACVSHIGTSGLLDFNNIQAVQTTGSVLQTNGDTGLLLHVVEKILRINLW